MVKIKTGLGIGVIFAIILITLSLAFVYPANFNAIQNKSNSTFLQGNNESVIVTNSLESQVTDFNNANNKIDLTITNKDTGNSTTINTMAIGDTETILLSGDEITVTYDDKIKKNFLLSYVYPTFLNWPSGAKTVIQHFDIILIMVALITMIGLGLLTWGVTK